MQMHYLVILDKLLSCIGSNGMHDISGLERNRNDHNFCINLFLSIRMHISTCPILDNKINMTGNMISEYVYVAF